MSDKNETARQIACALYDHVGGRTSEENGYAIDTLMWNKIYALSVELVDKIEAAVKKT